MRRDNGLKSFLKKLKKPDQTQKVNLIGPYIMLRSPERNNGATHARQVYKQAWLSLRSDHQKHLNGWYEQNMEKH